MHKILFEKEVIMIESLKKNKITRKILVLFTHFLSVLNIVIPKNSKKILFYDSAREFLDDNTEALYSWLKNNKYDKKYKFIVCVPKEKKRNKFLSYCPTGAIKGVLAFLTSKYVFFSFGDFRIRPSKSQIVINQWHGTGTKKGGKLLNDDGYKKERLDNFTYLLVSSESCAPVMAKQFGCSKTKLLIMGSARNDYLFSKRETLSLLGIDKSKYNKVILWMPTFRVSNDNRFHDGIIYGETMLPILYSYQDLKELNSFLEHIGVLLVIKVHPLAQLKVGLLKNIIVLKNEDIISKWVRLYEFVKEFDALITDYSSVFPDFLLLDRPIGFTMDDYEDYEKMRGFFFDNFKDYMPGHHMYNIDDIHKFVTDLVNGIDEYKEERKRVLPIFWKYTDGNNCKRLAKKIGISLED